ncbi:MAG: SufD family Fe-S cluster assembly protein, partial [Methanocellales archaeon]|nr:SufD family Fe-S cluster assembly protein [Methanocellales archaeon]
YVEKRKRAQEMLKRAKPAKYGSDVDLDVFNMQVPSHGKVDEIVELSEAVRSASRTVGTRDDEEYRSGTYFQYDNDVVYLKYTEWLKEHLPEGLIVLSTDDAVRTYPWLEKYWFRELPMGLDKYTTYVAANSVGGAFVWVQEGAKIDYPIQACLFMGTDMMAQVPHNFIIAEPRSRIHLITGCTVHPACKKAAHIAATEIYIKEGAEVTWSMIHSWGQNFHVRPRMGAIVEENGTLNMNYILLTPVKSIQMYPTVILKGEGARASFRNLIFGRGKSNIDVGSGIIFSAEETRGEIISRAVIMDGSMIDMRGLLRGNKPNTRGHLECRGLLLSDKARARAHPSLDGRAEGTDLTHEAAVGKIAEEQLYYLMTRGLSEGDATSLIARGFLDTDIPGLPPKLQAEISKIVSMTAEEVM